MSFLGELRRRKIYQVAAVYAVVAWLLVQIVTAVEEPLHLPSWTDSLVIVLLAIGFPVTLIMSWAYNLTPDGFVRDQGSQVTGSSNKRRIEFVLIGLLAVAVVWVVYRVEISPSQQAAESSDSDAHPSLERPSIAVLPLDNLSPDPENAFFADGIHDDLLTQLAKIGSLKVISRTSVLEYRDSPKNIRQIGQELDVATILEGGVRKVGNAVRINVQLIDTETDEHIWAETYDRELTAENIFTIQREMATSIAAALHASLSSEEVARLGILPTRNTHAYNLYSRGRYFWNQRTEEGFDRGLDYFEQAIAEDPNYALAYAGVASIHVLAGHEFYARTHPRLSFPKAQAAARTALEIDETLAEAHSILAEALFRYERDLDAAEQAHRRAIALNPNNSIGRIWFSHLLLPMGRKEESLAHSLKALENDPLNLIINLHLGWHHFYTGDYEPAINQLQQTLELNPDFVLASLFLGQVYEQQMRFEEAISQFEHGVEVSGRNPIHLAALGHGFGVSGRQDDAEAILKELLSSQRFVPSYEIAVVYAGLRRDDEALTWLERAYEERDSGWLVDMGLDPRFAHLRSSSRFQALMQSIGLP